MDGSVRKGFILALDAETGRSAIEDASDRSRFEFDSAGLKALFFVRKFEGDRDYNEKKDYTLRKSEGPKVCVIFNDGEALVGYMEGEIPDRKEFHFPSHGRKEAGFYVIPADGQVNNIRAFIFRSAVQSITVAG